MYFSALVLLPLDTINIEEKIIEILAPYYSELEVEPYKEYLTEEKITEEIEYLATLSIEEIEKIATTWEIPSHDLRSLAKIELGDRLGWFEEEADGIDEVGLYKMTTINPQGKWDYYRFIEIEALDSETAISYPCRVIDLPEVIPYAIVTSNGEWHELGDVAGMQTFVNIIHGDSIMSEEETAWQIKVRAILKDYSDCICVALRCHI